MTTTTDTTDRIKWDNSELKFFARFDGPYSLDDIELGNHPLRKIIERQFEYMSRNLYFISAFGRYLLGFAKEAEVVKAEDIASRTIQNALDAMGKRIAQAEVLLKGANITDKVFYGKKQSIAVPITSPGARMYATLLLQTDHFYSLNSQLWFHGEIDNKTRFANESDARKDVNNVVRGVASQFLYILKKTREKDAVVASGVGDHDEDKLAANAERMVDEEMTGKPSTAGIEIPAGRA